MSPVAYDYETIEVFSDGSTKASTEYYRDNFRVASCAFTERRGSEIVSWYTEGEQATLEALQQLGNRPVIVHNAAFEMGVTKCRFPQLNLNWHADTMRLVQNYDNCGGDDAFERIVLDPEDFDEDELEEEANIKYRPMSGSGLVVSCKRILGLEDHKKPAHDWIYANVPEAKKGKAGQHLDKLPPEILEAYTVADTERTLALYEHITEHFVKVDYDWSMDHALYLSTVGYVVGSKILGVPVNRNGLLEDGEKVLQGIAEIENRFKERFAEEIKQVEKWRLEKRLSKYKTEDGKKKYLDNLPNRPDLYEKEISFNVGSNDQLQYLFTQVLKMEAKFFTAKNSPSFKSTMLSQWGDGGLLLGKRRKRLLVLKQICNLYKVSEYDNRFHPDLKTASVATGRFAGGSAQ